MATGGALGRLNVILGLDSAEFTRGMTKAEYQSKRSLDGIATSAKSLQRSFQSLTGGLASYFSARQIIQYADAWTGLENRLRLVTTTQGELTSSVDDVYQISKRTNQELDSSAQIYQRFAQNAAALGITLNDVAGLTDTVAKAVAISGASADSAQAALTQFGQSLASGVFRGQEFNSVMEQTPGLAMAIARGFGVTIGELRRMANAGELTADQLVVALQKAKDSVDEQFNTRVKTVAMSFTNLQTTVTRFVGGANNALGGTQALGGAIDSLSDMVEGMRSNTDGLANDLVALGAAFDAVVYAVTETYDASNEFGSQFQEMLTGSGESVTELGDLITTSFTQSFLATAKELDALWDAFDGSARALEALFEAATYNIQAAFENIFNAIREMTSEAVHNIATSLNELPGIDIDTSVWVGPGQKAFKSLSEAASDAYAQGGQTLSLYDDLTKKLANAAIERSLAAEGYTTGLTGGPARPGAIRGSGPGSDSGKAKKPTRLYVADDLDEMLVRMGEADEWLGGYELKAEKTFDKTGEFALEAARSIQNSLGDGLYDILSGNFDDIGSKFGQTILRMASDAAAANLAGALFGDYDKSGKVGGLFGSIVDSIWPSTSLSGVTAGPGFNLNAPSYFDTGGYTGPGGKYEPKGIVHAEEGVLNRDEIRSLGGPSGFNALRRAIKGRGHAMGGMAGNPGLVGGGAAAGLGGGININTEVHVTPGSTTAQTTGDNERSGRQLASMVEDSVRGIIARETRQGGVLWNQRNGY